MKSIRLRLAAPALAVALGFGLSVAPALAYFTASDAANGGKVIKWPDTDITEEYGNGEKLINISNDEDSVPVYIRARAYIPAEITIKSIEGPHWSLADDGWYVYSEILEPGDQLWVKNANGETVKDERLRVKIQFPFSSTDVIDSTSSSSDTGGETGGKTLTKIEADGSEYNVIIVYEAKPVKYDSNNHPLPPEWN